MTEDAGPPEALDQALERLRLEGAIFMRAEHSESWALEGMGGPNFAAMRSSTASVMPDTNGGDAPCHTRGCPTGFDRTPGTDDAVK